MLANVFLAAVATASVAFPTIAGAQVTAWDGVYTVEQAARGKDAFTKACADCHRTGEAPAVIGSVFVRRWFEDSLFVPFAKMSRTMPDDLYDHQVSALPERTYVDILSYLLEAAGFPAGSEPLTGDSRRLASILIADRSGPGGPVPNFSMVQVVGCLTEENGGSWILTNGTRPGRTRVPGNSPAADLPGLAATPLGGETFLLQGILPQHRGLKGHKVQAKGILIRNPNGDRLNLTALQGLSEACTK
jgi:hypothetical protein